MTSYRLASGGLIDRDQVLNFTYDGRRYQGYAGDTIASALLANGVRVMGRSFKYHRPRGVWGAWVDEPNAIMTVSLHGQAHPNCLATTTYLEDGMQVRSVNAWPSAQFDIKGGLDLFHRWLGAGFYYKTFMWPNWHLFEPMIRRMAGLGPVSPQVDDGYVADQIYDQCGTLVVGAGIAGLTAAHSAAQRGEDVVLVDDQRQLGGTAHQLPSIEGMAAADWIAQRLAGIEAAGGRILPATTAFGVYDHQMVGLVTSGAFATAPTLTRMRAGKMVLATGALDRPMTFSGNDRPGIMSLLGAQEYAARYGVLPGRAALGLSTNSRGDLAVQDLQAKGLDIRSLPADQGPFRTVGGKTFKALAHPNGATPGDCLLVSGGLTPVLHLWRHAGGKLDWDAEKQAFLPGHGPGWIEVVGAAGGCFEEETALASARGDAAGTQTYHITPHWPEPGAKGRQWIDFQHDVTLKDIELAARENYASVEHLKRYTTLGMASDQGKTSNMAGLAALAALQGKSIPETGTTTFRPPFVPIPIETYHGHHRAAGWHPVKRLPLEPQHRAADAALCEYGGWLRPGWYGRGDRDSHIQFEAKRARETAGLLDGSPLGKIEVMGPDAEAFVNFVYYNTIRTLKPGHIRYGFMLTEGGIVFDDGVVARLGPDRFLISCSSSHVDGVRTHLEAWRQDGNDPDRIFVHDLTQSYATLTLTGPKARDVLGTLELGVDLDAAAFPHMTFRKAEFDGHPLRLSRVSFSGDTSFELTLRASAAPALWDALVRAGEPHGAILLGIEAMSILRAEKGYLMIGKDTDGETMPHDLGFGVPRQKKKTPFVGDRSLHSAKANAKDRKQLVGLRLTAGQTPLTTGAHVVDGGATPRSIGYVTSSYFSPTLGHPIALGIVERGADLMGEEVTVHHLGAQRQATVCAPCFFDPEGSRLHAR